MNRLLLLFFASLSANSAQPDVNNIKTGIHEYNCSQSDITSNTNLVGSDPWRYDSNICLAAIQKGVINHSGGVIKFILHGKKTAYTGTIKNGITSSSLSESSPSKSFTVLDEAISNKILIKKDNYIKKINISKMKPPLNNGHLTNPNATYEAVLEPHIGVSSCGDFNSMPTKRKQLTINRSSLEFDKFELTFITDCGDGWKSAYSGLMKLSIVNKENNKTVYEKYISIIDKVINTTTKRVNRVCYLYVRKNLYLSYDDFYYLNGDNKFKQLIIKHSGSNTYRVHRFEPSYACPMTSVTHFDFGL